MKLSTTIFRQKAIRYQQHRVCSKKPALSPSKGPSSPVLRLWEGKAAALFARGAYWQYVSTGKGRERRWRLFSTDPARPMPMLLIQIVACLFASISLVACVGKFETTASLTATCQRDWQQEAGMETDALRQFLSHDGLHVLVWNIHDRLLPGSLFSGKGHSEEDVVCIGDLASRFDLVLLQEAFVRPAQIARYTSHRWADHSVFSKGGGGDWWPLNMVCEICVTSGLLMLAHEKSEFVHAEPYEAFAGWNTDLNKADNFFSKGFQLAHFPDFWVLNSHMDSGRGEASIEARVKQLQQITKALNRLVPDDDPLLIGMDSNLRPDQEQQDRKTLHEFLRTHDLTLVRQDGPDLIAARNLIVHDSQILALKGVLSDHNALIVTIVLPR